MWKLRTLDLSANKITSLSNIEAGTIFDGNTKLQFLNLASNPLSDLGDGFDRILYSESLISLDVSHCFISHLQGSFVLQSLPKLVKLNLSGNPIARLDGLLSESLSYLDVTNCNLQFLRFDSLIGVTRLEELRCSSNTHLSDQLFRPISKSITSLDASYCALSTNYASELAEVRRLNLKGNQIKELVAYAFQNNTKLEILDLSENLIRTVDRLAFYGAELLRQIDLSDNAIVTLDENTFAITPLVVTLNLSRNSLHTLSHFKCSGIQVLDASRCDVRSIDAQTLIHMSSLQSLNLSYNFLEDLPDNLSSLSLQSLDLRFCRISSVSLNYFTFHQLRSLADLNLDGNRLVSLKSSTFSALTKLTSLSLRNNLWKCDCNEDNFKKLAKNLEAIPQVSPLLCLYPENVTGQRWQDACSSHWNAPHRRSKDIIILSVIVIVLLISGMVACFVAVKEGLNVRANRRREQELENRHDSDSGARRESYGNDEIRESVRKFTQLPSYDEALLLPKPPSSSSFDTSVANVTPLMDRNEKIKKRQSATQTDETIEALLQEIEANEANKESPSMVRRSSLQEIEYINIRPPRLSLQCTEL
ncbi:toll-like receptor 6 isoform X2 [Planococcus citri]